MFVPPGIVYRYLQYLLLDLCVDPEPPHGLCMNCIIFGLADTPAS